MATKNVGDQPSLANWKPVYAGSMSSQLKVANRATPGRNRNVGQPGLGRKLIKVSNRIQKKMSPIKSGFKGSTLRKGITGNVKRTIA
jgi:hypothetical protein